MFGQPKMRLMLLACTALTAGVGLAAQAAPSGASYDPQTVSVSQAGARTTVTQTTARAVVDWSSFDVGAQEAVAFSQPGSDAAILNRIHSPTASQIDGTLTAPGRVIIQNGNGVFFGANARVDVGSLVATTLQVDKDQFLGSGRLVLNGLTNPDAGVANAGQITAADKGLVALVGARVANSGVIKARLGTVALASGAAATIDFGGDGLVQIALTDPLTRQPTGAGALVANSGHIAADGGSVLLSANAAAGLISQAINLSGVIEARSVGQSGGQVALLGGASGQVTVADSGVIDVSGTSGGAATVTGQSVVLDAGSRIDATGSAGVGGTIRIGGDYRGQGSTPHAQTTSVAAGAVLDASGASGGGTVVAWSDRYTAFDGTARAGASASGAGGGLVETSSAGVLSIGTSAQVSTASPLGANGVWLLDPDSISIVASGGSAGSPTDANNASGASTINASTIVSALASSDVELVATNLISVDAPIIATSLGGPNRGLQLITEGEGSLIRVNAPILLQDGNLALRSEGGIQLGTVGSTETDYNKRAIIAVGNGTVWLQTGADGAITQADNSAIIAANLGMVGGSVQATSWDNFTLNLAGVALNGTFNFHETNATGVVSVGEVLDPFVAQSVTGIIQISRLLVGTQTVTSTTNPYTQGTADQAVTLSAGGQEFDTAVFSAGPLAIMPGGPTTPPTGTDASDYAVRSVSYMVGGQTYSLTPETVGGAPAGFSLAAENGSPVAFTFAPYYTNQAWGVSGFSHVGGIEANEINYDPINNISQSLIMALGGRTTQVNASLRTFFAPDFENPYAETAIIQLYQTNSSAGTAVARQGLLTASANSATRVYGQVNPALSFLTSPVYLGVDQFIASHLTGYDLPQPQLTTTATPQSNVGDYPINIAMAPSGYVSERYAANFTPGVLTITPATLTVQADDQGRQYGDPNPPLTWTVTGWVNDDQAGNAVAANLSTTATQSSNVGAYPITVDSAAINGAASGNYVINRLPGTLTISAAPLLLVAADDFTRLYGDDNPLFTFTTTGWKGSDADSNTMNATLTSIATKLSNVGDYSIVVSNAFLTGPAAGNYVIQTRNGVLTIIPAPLTVTPGDYSKVYGDLDPNFVLTASGLRNGDTIASVLRGGPIRDAGENVGAYPIRQGGVELASNNYVLTYVNGTLRITQAPIYVVADPNGKVVGEDDPVLTYTVDGLKHGDPLDKVLGGDVARDPGEEIGRYIIRQGSISVLNPNYLLVFTEAPFIISPTPKGFQEQSYRPWTIDYIWRGRDPDTPGDAVYRTTQYENPWIPDPLMRAYGLGGVSPGTGGTVPVMLQQPDWLSVDNDRVGQHADRPPADEPDACVGAPLTAVSVCSARLFMANYWAGRGR